MNFQIVPLSLKEFLPLFELSDAELAKHRTRRVIVDANPGFPCRVSLEDAEVGERVILLNYTHQPADSPYRATGPIFVREKLKLGKAQASQKSLVNFLPTTASPTYTCTTRELDVTRAVLIALSCRFR